MGKGSHDPQANEPAKLAARTLTMKRSASRDLLGDALDCAASCIDAAALDAYRLDYASSASAPRYPDTSLRFVLAAATLSARRRRAAGHGVATDAPNLCKSTPTRATPAAASSAAQLCRHRPQKSAAESTHTRAAHAVAEPPANRKKTQKKTQVSTGSDARREGRTAVGQRRQGRHDSKRI